MKILKYRKAFCVVMLIFVYWLGSVGMAVLNQRTCDKIELMNIYDGAIKMAIIAHRGIDSASCNSDYAVGKSNCTANEIATGDICDCNIMEQVLQDSNYNLVLEYINKMYMSSLLTYHGVFGDIIIGVNDAILSDDIERDVVLRVIQSPGQYITQYDELVKLSPKERYMRQDFYASVAFRDLRANQAFEVTIVPLSKLSRDRQCKEDGLTIMVRPKEM